MLYYFKISIFLKNFKFHNKVLKFKTNKLFKVFDYYFYYSLCILCIIAISRNIAKFMDIIPTIIILYVNLGTYICLCVYCLPIFLFK